MRLVADESVDGPIVERLRAEGHEVTVVTPGSVRIRQRVELPE